MHDNFSKSYADDVVRYSKRYVEVLFNPQCANKLLVLSKDKQRLVMASLSNLSKFTGLYQHWKQIVNKLGFKWTSTNGFAGFLRIMKSQNSDILEWVKKANAIFRSNEQTLLKFNLLTEMRVGEAINSFNLIITLNKQDRLDNYYNQRLSCLEHYKFKDAFLRRNKNVYISFIPSSLLARVSNSQQVTYESIRKRCGKIKLRMNGLRDFYGTYMLQHGLLEQELNLLQGRFPASVFVRHYWTPDLEQLKSKVLRILDKMTKEVMLGVAH